MIRVHIHTLQAIARLNIGTIPPTRIKGVSNAPALVAYRSNANHFCPLFCIYNLSEDQRCSLRSLAVANEPPPGSAHPPSKNEPFSHKSLPPHLFLPPGERPFPPGSFVVVQRVAAKQRGDDSALFWGKRRKWGAVRRAAYFLRLRQKGDGPICT